MAHAPVLSPGRTVNAPRAEPIEQRLFPRLAEEIA
jgi:hypothetical protein